MLSRSYRLNSSLLRSLNPSLEYFFISKITTCTFRNYLGLVFDLFLCLLPLDGGGVLPLKVWLRQLPTELGPEELQVPILIREIEGGGETVPLLAHANIDGT